jgi:hypothetical protein
MNESRTTSSEISNDLSAAESLLTHSSPTLYQVRRYLGSTTTRIIVSTHSSVMCSSPKEYLRNGDLLSEDNGFFDEAFGNEWEIVR